MKISHVADLTPAPQERLWHSAPHPQLPIVATCGADKTIRIYSLLNFTLISSISGGHKRSVRSSAWKPNSQEETVLATASFDATVGIWKRWNDFKNTSIDATEPSSSMEDGNMDADNEDGDDWTFAVLLDGHDSEVKAVSWSPSGSFLATCSRDKSIWIWEDLEDGESNFETIAVLQDHQGDVKCVCWHPEEDCLASGGYDNTIRIWKEDIDDWTQAACLTGHDGTVWSIDWEAPSRPSINHSKLTTSGFLANAGEVSSSDPGNEQRGSRLASCSDDRTIRIWRKVSQQSLTAPHASHSSIPGTIRTNSIDEEWVEENILPIEHDLSIYSVSWSKRTGLLASTGADGKIVVYAERPKSSQSKAADNQESADRTTEDQALPHTGENMTSSEWYILSVIEAAHGTHEVNNICWAKRAHSRKGSTSKIAGENPNIQDEVLLSTGDDGVVRAWEVLVE